jgi:hypothetical protein
LQQPSRHARQGEANRRDGIHGHQTGQDPLEYPDIERPTNEDHATHEYGQDARHPRENSEEANKPENRVVFLPAPSGLVVYLTDDPVLPLPALPTQTG